MKGYYGFMKNTKNHNPAHAEYIKKYPAPPSLTEHSRAVWNEVIPVLVETHGEIKGEGDIIRAYCIATAMFRRTSKEVDENPVIVLPNGKVVPNPQMDLMKTWGMQMRQYAEALGLTVKERKRILRLEKKDLGKRSGAKYEAFKTATAIKK